MAAALTVKILGDVSGLSKGFKTAEKDAKGFSGRVSGHVGVGMLSLAKSAGIAGLAFAGAQGLSGALHSVISSYTDHEKVASQTRAALHSTGHAAGISSKQIDAHADAIEKLSGVDADAVQSGENMLLTFTNIRNETGKGKDIFNQTTKTMADMSVALGQSMPASATMLGKALNDPIKGVGALSRVGVTFDDQQKKLIKTYQEHGQTAKAQAVILKELQKEFGGSAKAAGQTLTGKIAILKAHFFDFSDGVVKKVIPMLTKLVTWLTNNLPAGIAKVQAIATQFTEFVKRVWARWGDDIILITHKLVDALGPVFKAGFAILKTIWKAVGDVLEGHWSTAWARIKTIPGKALDLIVAVLRGAVTLFGPAAKAIGSTIKDKFLDAMHALPGAVKSLLEKIPGLLLAAGELYVKASLKIGGMIVSGMLSGLSSLGSALKGFIEREVKKAITSLNPFSPVSHGGEVYIGNEIVKGAIKGLTHLGTKLKTKIQDALRYAMRGGGGIWADMGTAITNQMGAANIELQKALQLQDRIQKQRDADRVKGALETANATVDAMKKSGTASAEELASALDAQKQAQQDFDDWQLQQRIDTLQSQSDGVVGIDLQSWNTGFNPITGSSTSGAMGIAGSGLASQTVAPSGVPTIVFNQVPAAADPQAIAAAIAWKLRTVSV